MTSDTELALRPSWRKCGRVVLRRFGLLVIVSIGLQFWLAGLVGGRDSGLGVLALALILFAVIADVTFRMSTVIRVSPTHVVIETMRLLRREVPRARVGGMALRGIPSWVGARLYAILYDQQQRCIATLPEGIWDENDLDRLLKVFGAKDQSIKYVTSGELAAEFPGALSVQRGLGWGLAVLVIALMFLGAALGR
jgi:hypothetical protein